MAQFAYGSPLVGDLSHDGVYPRDTSLIPSHIEGIRPNSQSRFRLRTRTSGVPRADALFCEANKQVTLGWLSPPLPIDLGGSGSTFAKGSVNVAFRCGFDQADKLRACDDINHNEVNLYFCTIWTPVKLPTRDHNAQMCLGVRPDKKNSEFPNADYEAAYKQLPLRPEHANLAIGPPPPATLLPPFGWPSIRRPSFSAPLPPYCAITASRVS